MIFGVPLMARLMGARNYNKYGSDGLLSPGWAAGNPGAAMGEVSRGQWQEYQDRYMPVELAALEEAQRTDFQSEGDRAGVNAARQAGVTQGTFLRDLDRRGITMNSLSQDERAGLTRRLNIANTTNIAGAENVTRRAKSETNLNALAQMVGIGRGIARGATDGLATAANAEAQRNLANKAAKAQQTSTALATIGTIAAILIK